MRTSHIHFGVLIGSQPGWWDDQKRATKPTLPSYLRHNIPNHFSRCNGLTDLAKRVRPTPAVDATLAPSYSFERAGGLAPQPFLAPRGWHRLAIATTCCNDHILTFTRRLWSLVPQAWRGYHGATFPRPRICRSRKSVPCRTWTGDLCFDTKCNGLTDLAKRVRPTPVVDATLAPSYSWRSGGICTPTLFGPSRLAPVSNCNHLLQWSYPYPRALSRFRLSGHNMNVERLR